MKARLFLAHTLRYFGRHKTLTILNIAGVALGVAVFVAVRLANQSALQSFRASIDLVAGRANLEIGAYDLRFSEGVIRQVWEDPAVAAATPLVEQICALPDFPGEYLHLHGVDAFTNGRFRTWEFQPPDGGQVRPEAFLEDTRAVAITEPLARRLGIPLGGGLRVRINGRLETLRARFFLKPNRDAVGADEHLAIIDIANAQELLGAVGRLNRILAMVEPGADPDAVAARLQEQLPPQIFARRPERRNRQIEAMLGAFQLNLTALSLISLLVGMFLVYNTVSHAVVRRRYEIGVLRALGVTGGGIQAMFLAEALLLGVVGAALGLLLGVVLAQSLVGAVSRTISSLYILMAVREVFLSPGTLALGAGAGLAAVAAAAWLPAREAAGVTPVQAFAPETLEDTARRRAPVWLLTGFGFAAGAWLSAHAARSGAGPAWLSFAAAACTVLAASFAVPTLSRLAGGAALLLARCVPGWITGRLAAGNFGRSLHRNSVTIAALAAALAMLLGLSIMIHSFRTTVDSWLSSTISADVFVAPALQLVAPGAETLPPDAVRAVRESPGALNVNAFRETAARDGGNRVRIGASDFFTMAEHGPPPFPGRDGAAILRAARQRNAVVISEPLARRLGRAAGDRLELDTPSGRKSFPIEGVFTDYSSSEGFAVMDRRLYAALWRDPAVNTLAVYLDGKTDAAAFRDTLRARLAPFGEFLVYANRDLRREVFRVFDQTFEVTAVLRIIALLVSGLGIFLTLTILVLERRRELATLRAAGATRAQMARIVHGEALLIGAVGSAAGVATGFVLAAILTYVVNLAFFGWTIQWAVPWPLVWSTPLWVLAACVAAAWLPARRAGRAAIPETTRTE